MAEGEALVASLLFYKNLVPIAFPTPIIAWFIPMASPYCIFLLPLFILLCSPD